MKPLRILTLALATVLLSTTAIATTKPAGTPAPAAPLPKGAYLVVVTRVQKKLVVSPENAPDLKFIKEFVEDAIPLKDGESVKLQVSRRGSDVTFKSLDRPVSIPK